MAQYQTNIPDWINNLIKDAANRDGRSKNNFIHKLLLEAANAETKAQYEEILNKGDK